MLPFTAVVLLTFRAGIVCAFGDHALTRPGSMNIYVPCDEVKKVLGLEAEFFYVRNGVSNDNALRFPLPIPIHVDTLDFVVEGSQNSKSAVTYSYAFNVAPVPVPNVGIGPAKTTIRPTLNVTKHGLVSSRPETVRMSVPCPRPVVAPGTVYPFSLVLNLSSADSNLANTLVFRLEKYCRIPPVADKRDLSSKPVEAVPVRQVPAVMAVVYFAGGLAIVVLILCVVSSLFFAFARRSLAERKKAEALVPSPEPVVEPTLDARSLASRNGGVESRADAASCVHPGSGVEDIMRAPSSVPAESTANQPGSEQEILERLVEKCGVLVVNREALTLKDLLMSGTFGQVWTGVLDLSAVGGGQFGPVTGFRKVYVKTVTEEASPAQAQLMIGESVIFADFRNMEPLAENPGVFHELRAVVWESSPPVLIYDFPTLGNLKKFLISCRTGMPHVPRRSHAAPSTVADGGSESCRNMDDCSEATEVESAVSRNFSTHEIVSIAIQVLSAIRFLHERNVTHGDIAARNCVMDENMRVKLCDTALARDLFPSDYHCLGDNENRPVRWMAYESIVRHELHPPSDIWSFGVFLWELNTLAQVPYGDVDPFEMPNYLKAGYRLHQPVNCPDQLYQMMVYCWLMKHAERPTCFQLLVSLEDFLKTLHAFV